AGRVAARPGKAGDQTKLDRVLADPENDRDRRGGGSGRKCSRVAARRGNNGHATMNEISHERRQAIVFALEPMVLHHHVPAVDVAGFDQASAERIGNARGAVSRPTADKADDRQCRLLRPRRERPRRRGAEQRDERAPPHSITSSARASMIGGISRPIALAVLTLITSVNLVGRSIGKSAALAPLRMRSMYIAARLYMSGRLGP